MYDENLTTLEESDYIADMFWLKEEESNDSLLFTIDEEMDMVTIDRTKSLIYDMAEKNIHGSAAEIKDLKNRAKEAQQKIDDFLATYAALKERG